ncbi:hypothetical protein R1sor_024531 [Riccia sorocarpa]|uniref:Uncharacterized protein n=1 Tax=Riccia sorocarpa TaxID=122646 RepID=A0ABD3GTY7_9MARC
MARDGPQAGAPLHFELYTEEDDDNYMRWKWISKKEARRVLKGIDPQLLTEFVKEFVLNWDDNAQRSTVDGEIVLLNKPLEVTGAFIYILKNKVGPASLNEDLDWASYFKEKIREEIRACRKQMMATGKRKIRPTYISIVILHILLVRGIVDDGQLVRSDSDESVEAVGDSATNSSSSADSLVRSPQNHATNTSISADSPVRRPEGDSPETSPQGVQDEGSPGDGRSGDPARDEGVFGSSPNQALPCSLVLGSSRSPSSGDADGTAAPTSTSPDLRRASISSPDSEVPVARPSTSPYHSTPSADRGQGDDVGVLEISPPTADVADMEESPDRDDGIPDSSSGEIQHLEAEVASVRKELTDVKQHLLTVQG